MTSDVHERLFRRLATAGAQARYLNGSASPSRCPLVVALEAMPDDELEGLSVLAATWMGGNEYRHEGSFVPPHPVRRLLAPFTKKDSMMPGFDVAGVLESAVRGADPEAFALLRAALEAEHMRRG